MNMFDGQKPWTSHYVNIAVTFKARPYLLFRKVFLPQLMPYIFSAFR